MTRNSQVWRTRAVIVTAARGDAADLAIAMERAGFLRITPLGSPEYSNRVVYLNGLYTSTDAAWLAEQCRVIASFTPTEGSYILDAPRFQPVKSAGKESGKIFQNIPVAP